MKKKLILIFILITCSMLGIIYFQVDRVHETYKAEFKRLNLEAEVGLFQALRDFHMVQQDSLTKALLPKLSIPFDTVGIDFSGNQDSLKIKLTTEPDVFKDKRKNSKVLTHYIGNVKVVIKDYQIAKRKESDFYATGRGDTLYIKLADAIIRPHVSRYLRTCNQLYQKEDSLAIAKLAKERLRYVGLGDLEFSLVFFRGSIQPIPKFTLGSFVQKYYSGFCTSDKKWVALYFPGDDRVILSRMLSPILISLILILTCIFSFFYLLKIILKQKRLAEMKDDFINNMTHELKTPIAIISAAVEGMQNFNVLEDKEKTNRYLNTSKQELARLDNLVTKVLHMASYEKNEIELSIDTIEVNAFITDIINSYKIHPEKQVTISFNNSAGVKFIHADPVHFRNVLANLIDNAIKYSGPNVSITINCLVEDNQVNFTVSDNGIGIPNSQLKSIFEKFHRVSTGNLHQVKGTGLGLSYVKYIMERHGGSVSVKSEVNIGSHFTVSLPVPT